MNSQSTDDDNPDEIKSEEQIFVDQDNDIGESEELFDPYDETDHVINYGDTDHVVLNGKIKIFYGQRSERYDNPSLKAYGAQIIKEEDVESYALICDRTLLPRIKQADVYVRMANPALNTLLDHGVVYWPPLKRECHVFVYEGGRSWERFVTRDEGTALGLDPTDVRSLIIPSLISALADCHEKDFFHGGIRLSNMYKRVEEGKLVGVILGDALSTPQSSAQPSIYLPAPSALADPAGRGVGSHACDIYAFGVSLALMLRHQDPLAGKTNDEIVAQKIKSGSYTALIGKDRFTGSILELLRGVLHDDPAQRWTMIQILSWVEGKRLSPKQNVKATTAQRPLDFNDHKYTQVLSLAMDLPKNPEEAVTLCADGKVDQWIERSLEDKEMAEKFRNAIEPITKREKGNDYVQKIMANALIVLNPAGPIHYKSHKILPDGIGPAMAAVMEKKMDIAPLTQLFSYGLVSNWLAVQFESRLDVAGLAVLFETCRNFLKKSKIGYGIERCVYVLNPQIHCLSPIVKDYIVYDSAELLIALEKEIAKSQITRRFIDRHIAAFLAEKDPKIMDRFLFDLDSSEEYKITLANLSCLALIKTRYRIGNTKNIARAFLPLLAPIINRYHDTQKREKLAVQVKKLAEKGDLAEIAKVLNDPEAIKADTLAFRIAMQEYREITQEEIQITSHLIDKKEFSKNFGGEISAAISCLLGLGIIVLTVLGSLGKVGFF